MNVALTMFDFKNRQVFKGGQLRIGSDLAGNNARRSR